MRFVEAKYGFIGRKVGAAIVGAVGAAAGTIEQDIEVAEAGLLAFEHALA
jgi:uncharacterized protein GlcG (DUF336 family)